MPFIKDSDIAAFNNLNKREIRVAKSKLLMENSKLKKYQFVNVILTLVVFFGVKFSVDSIIGRENILITYAISIAMYVVTQILYQGFIMRHIYLDICEQKDLSFEHQGESEFKVPSVLCATDENGKTSKRTKKLGILMVIIFGLVFLGVQLGFIH